MSIDRETVMAAMRWDLRQSLGLEESPGRGKGRRAGVDVASRLGGEQQSDPGIMTFLTFTVPHHIHSPLQNAIHSSQTL